MFRLHFTAEPPTSYRGGYQSKETKAIIDELLDHLFLKENLILINTCSCMLATTLGQKEIDRLSDALLNGFRLIKGKLEGLG